MRASRTQLFSSVSELWVTFTSAALSLLILSLYYNKNVLDTFCNNGDGILPHLFEHSLCFDNGKQKCAVPQVNWSNRQKPTTKLAAFYTHYDLKPGGGERNLITFARALQTSGYSIFLLVSPSNSVQTHDDFLRLCRQMDILIDPITIMVTPIINHQIAVDAKLKFDVYVSVGNDKFPVTRGIGYVNIYICQFPFDLMKGWQTHEEMTFFSYDVIIVYSEYVYRWYNYFIRSMLRYAEHSSLLPEVKILYPPVPIAKAGTNPVFNHYKDIQILVLGRFFTGRHNKVRWLDMLPRHFPKRHISITLFHLFFAGTR